MSNRFAAVVLFSLLLAPLGSGQEEPDVQIAASLRAAEGLEVTLWARSPQLFNPTSIDVDEQGRVWVAEAVNYRGFRNADDDTRHHAGGDRVVILSDTDGDGACDSSEVFVQDEDLVAPLGVCVIADKVYVSCSPHLIVYTRGPGDEVLSKEVLLTGFGGLDHDHSLHAAEAAPDGSLHFNVGNAGPHVVTDRAGWTLRAGSWYTGGSPHNTHNEPGLRSDDGRVWTGGLMLSVEPDGSGLRVLGHGFRNAVGTCTDSFGELWMNDNDDTQSCRTTWLMRYGDCGYNSKDGARSWQVDQRPGQDVPTAHWRQEDPGVLPSGHVYGNGSPTGIAYYENGALGAEYDGGVLLSCEAGQNVVWGYRRAREGAGFRLEPFPFLTTVDEHDPGYLWYERSERRAAWFRPSDVCVGADGAVYVADWIDPVVGGHEMDDREASGAIYRVTRAGTNPRAPRHGGDTPAALVARLRNPAPSVRHAAFHALAASGEDALDPVLALARDPQHFHAARALWLLPRLGERGREAALAALENEDPELRATALRALAKTGDDWLARAPRLAQDPDAGVRRALCVALRDVPYEDKREGLRALAQRVDPADRWAVEAFGTACEGCEEEVYTELLAPGEPADAADWSARTARLAWRLHPPSAVPAWRERALSAALTASERRAAVDALAFTRGPRAEALLEVALHAPAGTRDYASWWLRHAAPWDAAVARVVDRLPPELPGEPRFESDVMRRGSRAFDIDLTNATRLHLVATDAGDGNAYDWVDWVDVELSGPRGVKRLTELEWEQGDCGWGALHLGASCEGGPLVIEGETYADGVGGHAPMKVTYDISGYGFTRLRGRVGVDDEGAVPEDSVASVVVRVYHDGDTPVTEADDASPLPSVEALLSMGRGSPERGERVFFGRRAACSTCHGFAGAGARVGPDLTDVGRKLDRRALLEAVLDPSASVLAGYETWAVETTDGRLFHGFLVADGDKVVVRDLQGRDAVLDAEEIEGRYPQETSAMPSLELAGLAPQELCDLVAFLEQGAPLSRLARPFVAMDNGTGTGTPEERVALLAELGYDGIGWRLGQVEETLAALDARGLSMYTLYVGVSLDPDEEPYDPRLPAALRALAGRETIVWLYVTGLVDQRGTAAGDAAALERIGLVADLAREAGLRVALYPHAGFYVERTSEAVRLVERLGREDVGLSFNLCHHLKLDGAGQIEADLRAALPHLFLVQVNGAQVGGQDWGALIQPLDAGDFDLRGFFALLLDLGFSGPAALQCYGVRVPARENLERGMRRWRELLSAFPR